LPLRVFVAFSSVMFLCLGRVVMSAGVMFRPVS